MIHTEAKPAMNAPSIFTASVPHGKSGSSEFEIPFDRQELADYLDVDRSGLSVEISKLREEGVLESRRKHFRFL